MRSRSLDATSLRGLLRSPIGKLWGCRDERRRMGHSIVTCPSIYLTPKTRNASSQLTDVTHVFYVAFQGTPGSAANFASNTGPNREMFLNSVTAISRAAPHLKRVVLVTGTKYYGVHLGPLRNAGKTIPQTISHTQHVADCSLKQRLGPVAAAMKFVHWVCEEMDQRFAGYSV